MRRHGSWMVRAISGCVLIAACGAIAVGQAASPPSYPPSIGDASQRMGGEDRTRDDPYFKKLEKTRELARNVDRQKRMVFEAQRLLLLASELKATVQVSGALSEEDVKKLEEIEKLAKSVKSRMRD